MYYLYMIRNQENKLYVGVSENPEQRVIYHNTKQGAQFTSTSLGTSTKTKHNFYIVFLEKYNTFTENQHLVLVLN